MQSTEEYKNFKNPLDRITRPALEEVVAAVRLQPNSGKLDVRGAMGLKEAVLKYDTITFDDGALLMLEALAAPFIAIAARELLLDIKNPAYRAYISRPVGALETAIVLRLKGADGLVGPSGPAGGTADRIGQPGHPGQLGFDGADARTLNMPPIFFFVQRIKFGQLANPGRQHLFLNFQGFQGGSGGFGGQGGNGGKGGNGENGVSDIWGCREGGGGGGRGGSGGGGGHGGNAAAGGNGGSLYLFAPSADMFDYSTANIEGAAPGDPGAAGRGGVGGSGGGGAVQVGFCQSRPNGSSGFVGAPGNRGDASVGGNRGVQIPQTRDNNDLF